MLEWTVSGIVQETGIDKRTVERKLLAAGVHPFKKSGRSSLYRLADWAPAIYRPASSSTLEAERIRLTKAQADHEELKVAILRGDLIPASIVVELTSTQIVATRTKLLGMPAKLRSRMPELGQTVAEELGSMVEEALNELASAGLHPDLRARLAGYLADVEAAAKADGE